MNTLRRALSVLLVEDDPAHAELACRKLEELKPLIGDVLHVRDGQAALEHLCGTSGAYAGLPDLILLDLRMPRMNGLELLAAVKADATLCSIPVVVLTTSSTDADVARAYACGASSCLEKPLEPRALGELTRRLGCDRLDWKWVVST